MADVLMFGVTVVFFGLAVLLVRACDAIIGPDPAPPDVVDDEKLAGLMAEPHELVPS